MNKLTTKEFIKRAQIIHDNKYDYSLVNYTGAYNEVTIICPVHGEFSQKPTKHLHGKCGCQKCSGNIKKTSEQFIIEAKKVHNNKYNYSLVNYNNARTKIKIICPEHGIFEQTPNSHLSGQNCPKCSHFKTTEEFIKKAKKIHGNEYDYSLVKYVSSKVKVKIICSIHGIFEQTPNNHTSMENGCPICSSSHGEKKIREYLLNNNINFIQEYKFNNCRNKTQLPFDFYLPNNNILIEYDGKQHFVAIDFFGGKKVLIETQKKDILKNEYCLNNNIRLIRIKYNENIKNKLKECLNG